MVESHFEPSVIQSPLEEEVIMATEAIERIGRFQIALQAEYDQFVTERSSYGLHDSMRRTWLHKIDAVEVVVKRFNVVCTRLKRELSRIKVDAKPNPKFGRYVFELDQERTRIVQQMEQLRIEAKAHQTHELAPGYRIAAGGAMKSAWVGGELQLQDKLGQFGQDVLLIDRHKATAVVVDGTSTMPDSHSVAAVVAHVSESVLVDLPEEAVDDIALLRWYADKVADSIVAALEQLPSTTIGSATVFAARYFKKFDALVIVEVGDCEAALATATATQRLSYVPDTTAPAHFQKIEGKQAELNVPYTKPIVRVVSLAGFRQAYPNEPIHLIGCSDGLKNNSKQPLVEQASQIAREGISATLNRVGHAADDLTIFDMELPATT